MGAYLRSTSHVDCSSGVVEHLDQCGSDGAVAACYDEDFSRKREEVFLREGGLGWKPLVEEVAG